MNEDLSPEPLARTPRQNLGETLLTCLLSLLGCVLFILLGLKMTATAQTPSPTPTPTPPPESVPGCTPTLPPVDCTLPKTCSGCGGNPNCEAPPWPTPAPGDGPEMTPIPDAFQYQTGSKLLQWRVYTPDDGTSGPWPAVVVVHGGAFTGGSPFQVDVERVCEILAKRGFSVFNIGYRLAPCTRIFQQDAHDNSDAGIASGRPPQQTDDLMSMVMAARDDNRCKDQKVGVLGISSGGALAAYVALYTKTISGSGRPNWNLPGHDDRPECVAILSGVYDLADQMQPNDDRDDPNFITHIQVYTNTCSPAPQRKASPVSLVTMNTKNSFKPMFMVNSSGDHMVPGRQIFDMQCALTKGGVDSGAYTVLQITEEPYNEAHALDLWQAPDPNTGQKVGQDVSDFFHQYLD